MGIVRRLIDLAAPSPSSTPDWLSSDVVSLNSTVLQVWSSTVCPSQIRPDRTLSRVDAIFLILRGLNLLLFGGMVVCRIF
jgi:hypothetical protein